MASIVSSSFDFSTQADGRKSVHEVHVDNFGVQYDIVYFAEAADDLDAALAAHAVQQLANLKNSEIISNINQVTTNGSLASVTFKYSTATENAAELRHFYAIATRTEAVMAGDFLSTLTDGQLQTAFGLTSGQVTTLRTNKLTPAAALATSIRAAAGQ